MTYDRDIRFVLRVVWVLLAANMGMVAWFVWRREWIHAIATLIWIFNVLFWRQSMKAYQRTRDASRIALAAVEGMIERSRR